MNQNAIFAGIDSGSTSTNVAAGPLIRARRHAALELYPTHRLRQNSATESPRPSNSRSNATRRVQSDERQGRTGQHSLA